jgi:hypothetical protein
LGGVGGKGRRRGNDRDGGGESNRENSVHGVIFSSSRKRNRGVLGRVKFPLREQRG